MFIVVTLHVIVLITSCEFYLGPWNIAHKATLVFSKWRSADMQNVFLQKHLAKQTNRDTDKGTP